MSLVYKLVLENQLGVTPAVLHEIYKVPMKSIDNGTSRYNTKKSPSWAFVCDGKEKIIIVKKIPTKTIENFGIPTEPDGIIKAIDLRLESEKMSVSEDLIVLTKELENFCDVEWPRFVGNYEKEIKFSERPIYALAECALQFVVMKLEEGLDIVILHELIKLNCKRNKVNKQNRLKLRIHPGATAEYFEKKIIDGCEIGFSEVLVHKSKGKESKRKIPDSAKELIKALILDDRGHKLTKIEKIIQEETDLKVSYRTIRRIKKENREMAKAGHKGIENYMINRAPYFIGNKPAHVGDYAESDGTRHQFISKGKNGEIVFERSYTILDGHSGMPTSCIGKSENDELVMATFKLFVKKHKFLPKEIRFDGASAHTGERFESFREMSKRMGVIWRPAHSATDLAYVERYHLTYLTRIANGKDFYIGEGIKSKHEPARPSPERIAAYRNSGNLMSQEQLHQMFYQYQKEFCNDIIKGKAKNTLSKQEIWNRSIPMNAVKIGKIKFILLFGIVKRPTVQKGIITFTHEIDANRSEEYRFSIYRKKLLDRINFEEVVVRYDPSDLHRAYLFTKDNEFISTLRPSPSGEKTTFNQTEEGKKNLASHHRQKNKLREDITNELNESKNLVDEFEESIVPEEVVSPHDGKDIMDAANLEYFTRTVDEVDRVTEARRKRSKSQNKKRDRSPKANHLPSSMRSDSKQNANKYK